MPTKKLLKTNSFLVLLFVILTISFAAGCLSEKATTTTVTNSRDVACVAISSDGSKMVYGKLIGSEINLYLRDVSATATGEIALTYDSSENVCVRGGISGTKVVFSSNKSGTHRIYSLTTDNTTSVELVSDPAYDLLDVAFSKSGQSIVFCGIDRAKTTVSQIYMTDADGQNLKIITSSESLKRKPTVSADGKIVLFQKKVNEHWALYYVDISKNDGIESKFLDQTDSNLDAFDPEFLASGAQTTSGVEEIVFIHGQAGVSVSIERRTFAYQQSRLIRDFSNSYYFIQPSAAGTTNALLYLQKLNSARFYVWKTDLNGSISTQITF